MIKAQVDEIRSFNRFYTRQLGVLDEGLLGGGLTLTEVRVLYELAVTASSSASDIAALLGLDAGYLSRILRKFEACGYIERERSQADARSSRILLTKTGWAAFEPLNTRSEAQIAGWLAGIPKAERKQLVEAMGLIRRLIGEAPQTPPAMSLRQHQPGDIGWAIRTHGELYAREYGWNVEFEGLVAVILGAFAQKHDPQKERCWIAEVDGRRAGCVFLMTSDDDPDTGQLRCLLVDPTARGLGIGSTLVDACVGFAREAGYRRVMLWTNDVLLSARRIYQAAGFVLEREEQHNSFGRDLIGQYWTLDLRGE